MVGYRRIKTTENSNAVIPKLSAWSRSLTRGGPSQKVTTVDFAGKILVFWIGSRLREVVSHGGSTVFKIFLSPRWVRRRGMRQFGERVSMKLSDSHQNGH